MASVVEVEVGTVDESAASEVGADAVVSRGVEVPPPPQEAATQTATMATTPLARMRGCTLPSRGNRSPK
jgi:hypothetical protein